MTTTSNLSLPQWQKTDRIMMDDFNAAMANIDSGFDTKLGPVELISETTVQEDTTQLNVSLSNIDWDNWSIVALELQRPGVYTTSEKMYVTFSGCSVTGTINMTPGSGMPGPRLLVFTPFRNSANRFNCIHLPVPDILYSTSSTYANLKTVIFSTVNPIPAGSYVLIYGVH